MNKQEFITQLANEPHLINPDYKLNGLFAELTRLEVVEDEANGRLYTPESMLAEGKPYRLHGGIAVVPIHGYLSHRSNFHIPGMFTGYDYITSMVASAMDDPEVKGIALDVNSGGGMVSGAFEAASFIKDASATKPIHAIVDASAYSAAYLLASGATKIVASQTGGVGSIGVVTMHVDLSEALKEQGVTVTMLYAGEYKVDGNPYEALDADVKERIEDRLQESYNLFVEAVATNRGQELDVVRNTKAGLYQGQSAKDIRLVDAVMMPSQAYSAFAQELDKLKSGGISMSVENESAVTEGAVVKADATEAKAEERTRINSILGCDEAEGRADLANHLAFNTEMSLDAATAILAAAVKEDDTQESSSFIDAMNGSDNPNVGAEDSDDSEDSEMSVVEQMVDNWKAQTGRK